MSELEKEEWRPVVGYEGYYEVSNTGLVRGIDRDYRSKNGSLISVKGIVLKPTVDKSGYPKVKLSKKNKDKSMPIHRIVAIAFIPNPDNKPHVNHIDFNRANSNVKNLEWCTPKENYEHSFINGRGNNPTKGMFGSDHPNSVSVDVFEVYVKKVASFGSIIEASLATGVNMTTIDTQTINRQKKINGFVFRLSGEIDTEYDEFKRWNIH